MTDDAPPDERPVMTVYPSIASLGVGRALGALYESIPVRIGAVKLSHLLFPLPTAPLAMSLYFGLKAAGPRYLLTTHRLRVVRGLSAKPGPEVPLDEVGRVEVVTSFGRRFFKAGDLVVRDHMGTERLRLGGVVRPEMFRRTILDARDALVRTEEARRTIGARHPDAGAA
jgi:hypothetical protein